jgi:hypothetical protein
VIVHAIPRFIKPAYAAGNWKAVEASKIAFRDQGETCEVVEFDESGCEELLRLCGGNAEHLVMEYSFWPELIEEIRRKNPKIRIHVRTHNAQGLQHWQRVPPGMLPSYRNVRSLYGGARFVWRDSRCRRSSDTLLGISEWDDRHYWRFLPGKARILYFPYFSPWPYLRKEIKPRPWKAREPAMFCMPGARDRIGRSLIRGIESFADIFKRIHPRREQRFCVTKGLYSEEDEGSASPNIQVAVETAEPWDLMCGIKSVAVLTTLGYGFKTTIVDALAAGCHVLTTSKLARRLPGNISRLCIVCNPHDERDVMKAAERLDVPPSGNDLNESLREKAVVSLRSAVC